MSEKYKLYYFNVTVLGHPLRWMLALSEKPFEDIRVEKSEWPELKPKMGWGKMPVLKLPDGRELTQSGAIARFLATEFPHLKLAGSDAFENAVCDQLFGCAQDQRGEWRTFFFEADADKKEIAKKKLLDEVFPFYFAKFEKVIMENKKGGGKWLVGSGPTYADFFLTVFLDLYQDTVDPDILKEYPGLVLMQKSVHDIPQIKEFIAKSKKPLW